MKKPVPTPSPTTTATVVDSNSYSYSNTNTSSTSSVGIGNKVEIKSKWEWLWDQEGGNGIHITSQPVVSVQIPPNYSTHMPLNIRTPDGQNLTVWIPAHAKPGQYLQIPYTPLYYQANTVVLPSSSNSNSSPPEHEQYITP